MSSGRDSCSDGLNMAIVLSIETTVMDRLNGSVNCEVLFYVLISLTHYLYENFLVN